MGKGRDKPKREKKKPKKEKRKKKGNQYMSRRDIMGYQKPRGKKTRQGCSNNSRGNKKYRGQGGPRKRFKK